MDLIVIIPIVISIVALILGIIAVRKKSTASTTILDTLPSGTIVGWAGSLDDIPESWSICDGTNGTPDLRGRTIIGPGKGTAPNSTDHQIGSFGGDEMHLLTIDEMPSHSHTVPNGMQYNGTSGGGYSGGSDPFSPNPITTSEGGGKPHNIMSPYLCLCYIIKN